MIEHRICALGINAHNDESCMGIAPIQVSIAHRLIQSALTIQSRRYIFIRTNEKYIDKRSNFVTTGKKITNEFVKARLSTVYLQLKFEETQNDFFLNN